MSQPQGSEETWTDTIHHAITSGAGAVHRAIDALSAVTQDTTSESTSSDHGTTGGGTRTTGVTGTTTTATHPSEGAIPTSAGIAYSSSSGNSGGNYGTTDKSSQSTGGSYGNSIGASHSDSTKPSSTGDLSSNPPAPQPGQTPTPTMTDVPSHTSTTRSDPGQTSNDSDPSGPVTGGSDATQTESKDPSSKLPPPQTKGQGSATSRGDAPETNTDSASNQRQVNKGNDVGNPSDASAKFSGTQQSGPVSMSGAETSHPGSQGAPAGGLGAPTGDPSSGQAPKSENQGGANPLNAPAKKSKEDEQDEGTGQKYVKSSGVAAQGGDFDASKPGAGMEASRLLGKDGSKPDTTTQDSQPADKHEEHDEQKKAGLSAKIKGALHKD